MSVKSICIAISSHMNFTRPELPSYDVLHAKTLEVFGKRPCLFQCKLATASFEGCNIVSIAHTGSGKTLTYLMCLPFCNGKVIILVAALNVLGDQFVGDANKAGFSAICVTADNNNDKTWVVSAVY